MYESEIETSSYLMIPLALNVLLHMYMISQNPEFPYLRR